MNQKQVPAYFILLTGIVCIGFSAIFVKWAALPGTVTAFYRMLVAGVVIMPLWVKKGKRNFSRRGLLLCMAGGLFFTIDTVLWNMSLLRTSAATATLLANNAPLWVGIASFLFLREHPPGRFWLGLAVALCGMVVLVGPSALKIGFNQGDLLALAASFFYAGYLIVTRRVRRTVGTVDFVAVMTLTSLVLLFGINMATGRTLSGFSTKSWLSLAGLGVVTHLGGWLCISYALGHLRAAPVSVTLLGQAVVTSILAIPLLHESLGMYQIAGGILVLTGIVLANRPDATG
jgi:drug/metabolite transporter (DMT)-like permease